MASLLQDHSNLRQIIDEMKHLSEVEELSLSEKIMDDLVLFRYQERNGYPYQDVLIDSEDGKLVGIPVTLSKIVLDICTFCAVHNIDLVGAMEQAA